MNYMLSERSPISERLSLERLVLLQGAYNGQQSIFRSIDVWTQPQDLQNNNLQGWEESLFLFLIFSPNYKSSQCALLRTPDLEEHFIVSKWWNLNCSCQVAMSHISPKPHRKFLIIPTFDITNQVCKGSYLGTVPLAGIMLGFGGWHV